MEIKINTNPELINLMKKMPSLMFGLLLYSLGILATLYSNLGMSPWDVFHMGIINYVPLTLGQISQITGLVILIIGYFLGGPVGFGTLLTACSIGLFVQLAFRIGNYSSKDAKHVNLIELYKSLRTAYVNN